MLAAIFHQSKTLFDRQGVMFAYCGVMTEDLVSGLGETIRKALEAGKADPSTRRNLFAVFVEQMQNVIRYSADQMPPGPVEGSATGIIAIGQEEGRFFAVCGNVVRRDDVPDLRGRLEQLRRLDRDGLRALWKEKLRDEPADGSKGASIGLIEIARRSSAPVDYDFHDVDDRQAFFCIRAWI